MIKELALNALLATSWAFSLKQKKALDARDGGKCQAPFKHECKGGNQRHHILPQGYCQKFGIDPDFALNGIVLCENAHIRIIHPDAQEAKVKYKKGDKKAFEELRKERSEKLDERVVYWEDKYDRPLYATAVRNTQRAEKKGWKWPWNSHQKSDVDDSYKT
jgi:hypothetical protein